MKYASLKETLNKFNRSKTPPFSIQPVGEQEIADAERSLGLDFDSDLKEFWLDVGYGFFNRERPLTNKGKVINDVIGFSHPIEIAEMINNDPDRFSDVIPFFDKCDDDWFVLRSDGMVAFDYDPTVVVAQNVDDFIHQVFENARFWIDLDHDQNRKPLPA